MHSTFRIEPPFFEIGPKTFVYGQQALRLARHAEQVGRHHDVRIIFTPQYVDIPRIAAAQTPYLHVFAQHMDGIGPGRGVGAVLPEALADAGAAGVLLNHTERPLRFGDLEIGIRRAEEVGLVTLVCADTSAQAVAVAQLRPDIVLAEPPDLIGESTSPAADRSHVQELNDAIRHIDPRIQVLHSAGIRTSQDVRDIVALGADGTGCTSGIICADDPFSATEEMISAMRCAWDNRHAECIDPTT